MSTQAQPKRIQRRRTLGFNLRAASDNSSGVVYVGRPTRFGNPYPIALYGSLALPLFENTAQGVWNPALLDGMPDDFLRQAYAAHQLWTARFQGSARVQIRYELRGKDLACWCRLDSPCHADILLKLANQ